VQHRGTVTQKNVTQSKKLGTPADLLSEAFRGSSCCVI